MADQVTRRRMERWLLRNGFAPRPAGRTGHRQYVGHGMTVTLPGHGPPDLTKKHVGMLMRQLERAGFARDAVFAALRGDGG